MNQTAIPIAFGITDLDVGGAEKMFVELVTRLDKSRWTPSVVCLQASGSLAKVLIEQGIPVTSLKVTGSMSALAAILQWKKILSASQPQILQTFLFHANLLGRLAGRLAKVPHVVAGIRVAERRGRRRFQLDRWTDRFTEAHVCVSKGVKEHFARMTGIPDRKLLVIPNGIDAAMYDSPFANAGERNNFRAELGIKPTDRLLLFVGRLDQQKGVEDLLAELSILAGRRPVEESLRVVLVGDGPLRHRVQESIEHSVLGSFVRMVGRQSDLLPWYCAADGLVLTSHWEGMPNVVLEAMAARLPVLATKTEGIEELVLPGRTGWVIPLNERHALGAAIEDWLDHPDLARTFGEAGRHLVSAEYTLDRMVQRYDLLYNNLLKERHPPGALLTEPQRGEPS